MPPFNNTQFFILFSVLKVLTLAQVKGKDPKALPFLSVQLKKWLIPGQMSLLFPAVRWCFRVELQRSSMVQAQRMPCSFLQAEERGCRTPTAQMPGQSSVPGPGHCIPQPGEQQRGLYLFAVALQALFSAPSPV